MDYSIENTLLTDKEIDVLKRKADDKLVDVLCTLVNESGRTFYGNLRFNMFTNDIIGVNDQISKLDDLIRSIDRMSTDELKELANTYNVKKYSELNDSLLAYEVEKALRLERENLNEKSISLSSTYTINYKNTFEYFFNDCISKVEVALAKEHDIDNMDKYRILRRAFKNIQENLNTLHSLIDTMSVPATLLTDYNEELIDCESNIKELQDKLNLSYDYNEVVELENSLKLANEKRKNLKDAIKVQRENIINIYSSGNDQLDFSNMRTEILRCMIEVTSNSKEAFENNVLDKEDFFTEEDDIQIDKCSRAFQSFFYEIIDKEFAYKNYLDENEIVLNNQLRSHSSRFFNRSQESAKDKDSTKDENIIHVEKLDQPMAGLSKPEYTTGTVDIIESIKNQVELGKELDKEQTSTIGDIGEFVDSITATEKEMHPEKVVAYC